MAGIIDIPKFEDDYGTIYIADRDLPFEVKRVLWIHDLKTGRGEKAQKECEQIYVAVQGKICIEAFPEWRVFVLNSPDKGLHLPKMTWRKILNPSDDAILLVLCSRHYDPEDRIGSFEEFVEGLG